MNQSPTTVTPTAGVVAFTKDFKSVLLLKHTQKAAHKTGMYGIPAGHIDEGEESIETAIRELEEETGIRILNKNILIPVGTIYTATIETKFGLKTFSMETFTFVLEDDMNAVTTEEGEPELVLLSKLDSLQLLPNVQLAITDALTKLQPN
jgi:8-oxo-dGTP pyrophosphatase MutT (NUDIX family)